jgi:predicted Zn-dependent peptidase
MIETSRLANGVHIVTQRQAGRNSVALGLWLLNGARHEAATERGYAHLLEHLFFKGGARHDASALARHMEALGGRINAHAGRELTALHGLVPASEGATLLRLFSDLLLRPRFDDRDLAAEREVILQEMALHDSDTALEDRALALAWPDHPLGRSVLGSPETLAGAGALHDYLHRQITGGRVWVVAAGAVDHDTLLAAAGGLAALPPGAFPAQTAPGFRPGHHHLPLRGPGRMLWLMPIPPLAASDYPALLIANHILGGGLSSRLHQSLRERHGLVYGVQSRLEFFSDCGLWIIETADAAQRIDDCHGKVATAIAEILENGVTAEELATARRYLEAHLAIDEDSLEEVMDRLAREAIYLGRHPEDAELRDGLNRVDGVAVVAVLARGWESHLFVHTG